MGFIRVILQATKKVSLLEFERSKAAQLLGRLFFCLQSYPQSYPQLKPSNDGDPLKLSTELSTKLSTGSGQKAPFAVARKILVQPIFFFAGQFAVARKTLVKTMFSLYFIVVTVKY